jgi:hypothetical protein
MLLAWDGVIGEAQETALNSEGWTAKTDVSGWDLDRIMRVARILSLTGDEEQSSESSDYSKILNPRNESSAIGVVWDSLHKHPGRHVVTMN